MASVSCASAGPDTRKQLAALESDLGSLRQQNLQLLERVSALELQREIPPATRASSDALPPRVLPIVRLEPGSLSQAAPSPTERAVPAADSAQPDTLPTTSVANASDAPRPVIRVEGNTVLQAGSSSYP